MENQLNNAASITLSAQIPWVEVGTYIILAFALLWVPFFLARAAKKNDAGSTHWDTALSVLGPFSPLLAAVLVRAVFAREGFADAGLGIAHVASRWWLLALALPFFWNGVQDILAARRGFMIVDWQSMLRKSYLIPLNLFGAVPIFLGEEFGWRSYLLQKLIPLGRWEALLISGIIWALWHAPLVFLPDTIYSKRQDIPGAFLGSCIFVLFGFIFGWVYLESGSVWPVVLMHSYNNQIGLKLFSKETELKPTHRQQTQMAFFPVLLVWTAILLAGGFSGL